MSIAKETGNGMLSSKNYTSPLNMIHGIEGIKPYIGKRESIKMVDNSIEGMDRIERVREH